MKCIKTVSRTTTRDLRHPLPLDTKTGTPGEAELLTIQQPRQREIRHGMASGWTQEHVY
jgi:hypothetical protein